MLIRKLTLLLLLHFACVAGMRAQTPFTMKVKGEGLTPGKIFRAEIKLTPDVFSFFESENHKICFSASEGIRLLMPVCYEVSPSDEALRFPVKLLLARSADSDTVRSSLSVKVVDESTNKDILTRTFPLTVNRPARIKIMPEQRMLQLTKRNRRAEIPFRIANEGNRPEKIQVKILQLPAGLKKRKEIEEFYLAPHTDTVYILTVPVLSGRREAVTGNITTLFMYRDRKEPHDTEIRKNTAVNKYRPESVEIKNPLSFRFRYETGGFMGQRLLTESAGKISSDAGVTNRWRLRADYFARTDNLQLFNTFYEREAAKNRVRVGHINLRNEAPLLGRGVDVEIGEERSRSRLAIVNGNFALWSRSFSGETMRGNSFLLGHSFISKRERTYSVYGLHQIRRPGRASMTGMSAEGRTATGAYYLYSLNLSVENQEVNPDLRQLNPGFGGRLEWQRTLGRWKLYSRNYFSTPWYTGLQRGSLFLNERADYRLNSKITLSANLNVQNRNPQSADIPVNRHTAIASPRLNAAYSINSGLTLSFGTSVLFQSANYLDYQNPAAEYRTRSHHVQGSIRWNRKSSYLYLTGDVGLVTDAALPQESNSKVNVLSRLTYQYKNFGITGVYQKGGRYLFELYRDAVSPMPREFIALNPEIRFPLIKNKLNLNFFSQFTYDNQRKNRIQTHSSQLLWQINTGFFASAEVRYLSSGYFSNTNMVFSVKKNFQAKPPLKGHYDLDLHLFYDENTDGIRNPGERPAAGAFVSIGAVSLTADADGRVSCKDFPPGFYTVSITDVTGTYATVTRQINLTGDIRRDFPIYESTLLRGRVIFEKGKLGSKNLEMQTLLITAEGEGGFETQAVVRHDGTYTLELPAGDYRLYLSGPYIGEEISAKNNYRRIRTFPDQIALEDFILRPKERGMNIKRF